MKYRIKFEKGGSIKFIGHLDVMRLFQRAIKRANLPVKYSKGFNPHQIISFASPLSLGAESVSEYMDVEFTRKLELKELYKINSYLPEGVNVISFKEMPENEKTGMALLYAAAYKVYLNKYIFKQDLDKKVLEFISLDSITAVKKEKKGPENIRPDILSMKVKKDALYFIVLSGSKRNIKPEVLAESFYAFLGEESDRHKIRVKRLQMYKESGGGIIPLDSFD